MTRGDAPKALLEQEVEELTHLLHSDSNFSHLREA